MTKFTKTVVALWVGAAVGVALAEPPRDPGEPTYKGQPLRHWVEVLGELEGLLPHDESEVRIEHIRGGPEAQDALKHIGTNAVPYLFRWCGGWELEPPSAAGLSTEKTPALLPPTSQQKLVTVSWFLWRGALRALDVLGPEAAPLLLTTVTNKAYPLASRVKALRVVVKAMGTNGQALLPLVIQCADGDEEELAQAAVRALGTVGVGRPEALTVLEKYLQDPQRAGWRDLSLEAVARLGNISASTLAREYSRTDSRSSYYVTWLLVYNAPQGLTNTVVLAAAADSLRSADEDRRLDAAKLLRAADQQARGWKPDLVIPRREQAELLDSATNILRRLAPELLK